MASSRKLCILVTLLLCLLATKYVFDSHSGIALLITQTHNFWRGNDYQNLGITLAKINASKISGKPISNKPTSPSSVTSSSPLNNKKLNNKQEMEPGLPTTSNKKTMAEIQKQIGEEFDRRRLALRKMCQALYVESARDVHVGEVDGEVCQATRRGFGYSECIFSNNFPLARSSSTLTCLINKVASTSIASTLLDADGSYKPVVKDSSPHVIVSNLMAHTKHEFMFSKEHFFKFIVVRHPFRRLLSAYRDKVEKADHWSLLDLRVDIFDFLHQRHRYAARNPPIPQMDSYENTINQLNVSNKPDRKGDINDTNSHKIPTFEQFLEYILHTNLLGQGYESHWVPYWKYCAPCSMDFDVIAKLEGGHHELEYIWRRMGYTANDTIPWKNKSTMTSREEKMMLKEYYSSLSPQTIVKVFQSYLVDFKLFEYDIIEVLEMGNHCTGEECQILITRAIKNNLRSL